MFEEWKPTLTKEQIIQYLLEFHNKGFRIVEKRPPIIDGWVIEYTPTIWVAIRPSDYKPNIWDVCIGNLGRSIGMVGTLQELKTYVENAWNTFGIQINNVHLQKNVYKDKPVSNISSLITLLDGSKIEAIQDDYIDNLMLQKLIDMYTLGVKFDAKLRLLTTKNKVNSGNLTESFVKSFATEVCIKGEIRVHSNNHQRLIFMTDGRCISPDFSLNNFNNGGTITEIKQVNEKIIPFEDTWNKAEPLIVID